MTPLDTDQQAAVACDAPRILVRAGAGSGKTRVITERIARILEGAWHPEEVLALTFTRAAAQEMRERVRVRLSDSSPGGVGALQVTTFHAWCARTLRRYADRLGMSLAFSIIDELDRDELIVYSAREVGLCPQPGQKTRAGQWKTPARLLQEGTVQRQYQAAMREANAVDFDGLETEILRLLALPDVAAELRWRHRHVLVDEYQDTSGVQQRILDFLAPDHLFLVGDSAQSIYAFRGARVEGIQELGGRGGWTVLDLPSNYRSAPAIVDAANGLAAAMAVPGLAMEAIRVGVPGAVDLVTASDRVALDAAIAADIDVEGWDGQGRRWGELAVLAPTWRLLDELAPVLAARGIPHRIARRGGDLWDGEAARWLVAGLRVVRNPRDHLALHRMLRGTVDAATWARCRTRSLADELPIKDVVLDALAGTWSLTRVADYPTEWAGRERAVDAARWIVAIASLFPDLLPEPFLAALSPLPDEVASWCAATGDRSLTGFLDWYAGRRVEGAPGEDADLDQVTLTTIHGAKGLEWSRVWVLGLEEGHLPRQGSDVEEARRLAYVAVTRARDRLRLCASRHREPSRFLAEAGQGMPPDDPPAGGERDIQI